ncbi:MAG: UvrD-helicase domain-containing protein [Oscillospiraceae bacterium]
MSSKINMVKNYETDIDSHKKIMSYLSEILCKFSFELMKAKEEKNAVCFDDAEQIALNLLAECDSEGHIKKTRLAEELSDFYQIIMIDEFQDSNNRQDMIFRLLSRNGSYDKYGNNLFLWNVKQSICIQT